MFQVTASEKGGVTGESIAFRLHRTPDELKGDLSRVPISNDWRQEGLATDGSIGGPPLTSR